MFSHKKVESRNTFRQRRHSDPEDATGLVLEEHRHHLLAEAKSEILKQECKVDFLVFVNFKDKLIPIVWKWIT